MTTEPNEVSELVSSRWLAAVEWHTRLQEESAGPLTHERLRGWREWMAEYENQAVFDQVSDLMGAIPGLRSRIRSLPDDRPGVRTHSPASPSVDIEGDRPKAPSLRTRRAPALVGFAVAAGLSALALGLQPAVRGWLSDRFHTVPGVSAKIYQTPLARVESVSLPDGSAVTLGAHSLISVRFDRELRRVSLDRGEALFRVAHDSSRPFIVSAGAGTITAVGTAFVVRREADHVTVSVTEGAVQVAPGVSSSAPPGRGGETPAAQRTSSLTIRKLATGQQLTYAGSGQASKIEPADAATATGWIRGRLEFKLAPLGQVLDVVNRYSHRPIVLDASSENYIFTGSVLQEQIDDWLCGLEDIYPVELSEEGRRIVVRRRLSGPSSGNSICRGR